MTDEEWAILEGLLDGVEGYLSEVGYPRYWKMEVIERARLMVTGRSTNQREGGGDDNSGGQSRATRTPKRR